jgi:hypothetical protein
VGEIGPSLVTLAPTMISFGSSMLLLGYKEFGESYGRSYLSRACT